MKQFGLSPFPVGISAGLMTMLLLLSIMPSSTEGIEITVKADQKISKKSNQITVVVQDSTTVKELKEQIKKETGIQPTKQTLKLKQNGDAEKQYTVWVKGTGTVATLKEMIKNETGIEVVRQTLKFQKSDDNELDDDKKLAFYGFVPKLTIHLSTEKFKILVKCKKWNEEKQYNAWVNGTGIAAKLKQKMNNCNGIEVEGQTLKLKTSGGSVELEDDKKVNDAKQYTMWVNGTDTAEKLKQKIMDETGIETGKQTLKFQKSDGSVIELEDVNKLIFYGILPNSTIHLSNDKFQILVVDYRRWDDERNYIVWVNDTNPVKTLKQKIMAMMQNEFNTLIEDIGLSCSPTVEATVNAKDRLNNDSTLKQKMNNCSGIEVEGQTLKLKTSGEDEKKYTMWVNGMHTAEKLKQKIMEKTGIETGEQTLKLQKSDGSVTDELEDVKKLIFYGIVPNSTIHLSNDKFQILVKYKKGEEEKQYHGDDAK
ncbi:hypothetical protein niasHS_018131 [Heterodera schachtii]|uniref:Ubiquitin-like domain-containing protein n=1 Tax=Heterodera schachtii TaxID=97005 RepID=A0ABD2HSJ5_HETSC